MNLKLIVIGLIVLALGACDSQEPATSQTTSSQNVETAPVDATASTEPTPAPVVEQPVAATTEPAPAQQVAAVAQPRSGESIYKTSCSSCHATGAANAPRVGDRAAWKPRIDKGIDTLLQSAINGVPGTAMMKRGACAKCTDDELKSTIEYMISQSR